MTEQNSPDVRVHPATRLPNGRTLIVAALVLVAGLTGAAATKAFSQGPGGWGPGFFHHHGMMSQAQIEERADKMVRHLAVEVDATNEQQDKLRGIMRAAVKDVVPAAEKARSARLQARAASAMCIAEGSPVGAIPNEPSPVRSCRRPCTTRPIRSAGAARRRMR